MPTLADSRPEDIGLSIAFLAALVGVGRAAWHSADSGARRRWLGAGLALSVLLANQQLDAHSALLRAGGRALRGFGWSAANAPVVAASVLLIAAGGALALAWLASGLGWGTAPGPVAGAGLLLLVVHALGRSARLLHVLQAPWTDVPLTNALKAVEGLGLLLVLGGALRWTSETPRS